MFSLIRRPEESRLIDAGRVACPLRERDADVEDCLQCGFVRDVEAEAKTPFVRCRPPRKLLVLP
jgi:hypothetical protein